MNTEMRKFLLKAIFIGALGTLIGTSDYSRLDSTNINVPIWFTIMIFVSHFQIILLFWLAFENQIKAKNWLFAGFIGSTIYAILYWLLGSFVSDETSQFLIILKQLFIGALSAFPLWIAFKVNYPKAYLWIIANAIGYTFIEIYITNIHFISGNETIRSFVNYSFLSMQVGVNGVWIAGYTLLGLILGIFSYKMIEGNAQ